MRLSEQLESLAFWWVDDSWESEMAQEEISANAHMRAIQKDKDFYRFYFKARSNEELAMMCLLEAELQKDLEEQEFKAFNKPAKAATKYHPDGF